MGLEDHFEGLCKKECACMLRSELGSELEVKAFKLGYESGNPEFLTYRATIGYEAGRKTGVREYFVERVMGENFPYSIDGKPTKYSKNYDDFLAELGIAIGQGYE